MQARAIHGVAFVILPFPVSQRVVRRRRGRQGDQNSGPRKKSRDLASARRGAAVQRAEGTERVRVHARDEETGKGEGGREKEGKKPRR